MPPTAGTNQAATWSARRCTGAAEPCASSTRRMICARVVSAPTRPARSVKAPVPLSVPANTGSPTDLSAGILSPVNADSSSDDAPAAIAPSTGTYSPGRTARMSPAATRSTGMSDMDPSSESRWAVWGRRSISMVIAPDVRASALDSSHLPSRISATMMAAMSKCNWWPPTDASAAGATSINRTATAL